MSLTESPQLAACQRSIYHLMLHVEQSELFTTVLHIAVPDSLKPANEPAELTSKQSNAVRTLSGSLFWGPKQRAMDKARADQPFNK